MKGLLIRIGSYVLLIAIIGILFAYNRKLFKDLSNTTTIKDAYEIENSNLQRAKMEMKMTLADLELSIDSLNQKMLAVVKDNKIKTKRIQNLQYQLEHIEKADTVFIRDTIFKEPGFVLDTCLMDKWAKTDIHLQYPGTIAVKSEFNNEKYVIINTKRVPIKKRKWFLPRWFTRKHTVVEVTVVDQNPYVKTEKQRYIEIVK